MLWITSSESIGPTLEPSSVLEECQNREIFENSCWQVRKVCAHGRARREVGRFEVYSVEKYFQRRSAEHSFRLADPRSSHEFVIAHGSAQDSSRLDLSWTGAASALGHHGPSGTRFRSLTALSRVYRRSRKQPGAQGPFLELFREPVLQFDKRIGSSMASVVEVVPCIPVEEVAC